MPSRLLALVLLLYSAQAFAQPFPFAEKFEPLRQAIPANDLRQFTSVLKREKPDWYRAFFEKNPQFAAYREPACSAPAGADLPWWALGQGYFGLALAAQDKQRWDDYLFYAQVAYLHGIREVPACVFDFVGLGELYLFLQRPVEALGFLRGTEERVEDPGLRARLNLDLGIAFALLGQPSQEKKYLSLLTPEPGLPTAYEYFLAHAYFMEGNLAEARRHIERAAEEPSSRRSAFDPFPIAPSAVWTLRRLIDQAALRASSSTR
jgi:hypothetical protein